MSKIEALISKNKVEKATKKLESLLNDYSRYGEGWDLLSKIKYQEYVNREQYNFEFGGNITVEVEGEENDDEAQKMAQDLAAMLNGLSPAKVAYHNYINTLRTATLMTNDAYYSSILLRSEKVVINVDSNITDEAYAFYKQGERAFSNRNYHEAAEFYQKAIEEQPNYYKARLYLGDAYYFKQDYIKAIQKFNIAKEEFPYMLEPRKYLVDAYYKEGLYDKSLQEAIETFTIYPDASMKIKLRDVVAIKGKKIAIKWTQRKCFPNKIVKQGVLDYTTAMDDLNGWPAYKAAKEKVEAFCDEKGLISKNDITRTRYLEVYSWEELLKNDQSPELDEARKMQEMGYLDCYVFITCFHQDIYEQYQDFALNNKGKIIRYFNTFIK
jgi:tetratricopeptide (TPR) repeat protein